MASAGYFCDSWYLAALGIGPLRRSILITEAMQNTIQSSSCGSFALSYFSSSMLSAASSLLPSSIDQVVPFCGSGDLYLGTVTVLAVNLGRLRCQLSNWSLIKHLARRLLSVRLLLVRLHQMGWLKMGVARGVFSNLA